jgi:hypothetical protein
MTKRTPTLLVAIAASFGFLRAADPPSQVLIATALEPAAAIRLTMAPAPSTLKLNTEEPALAPQVNLGVPRTFGGFRPPADVGKALFDVNLLAMIGLNIADYVSTREALKVPGLHEANPLMQPFVKSPVAFAAAKIGTTALTYWSMKVLFKRNRTMAWILTTASNVLMSYVVANNLQRIHQARTL